MKLDSNTNLKPKLIFKVCRTECFYTRFDLIKLKYDEFPTLAGTESMKMTFANESSVEQPVIQLKHKIRIFSQIVKETEGFDMLFKRSSYVKKANCKAYEPCHEITNVLHMRKQRCR